MPLNLPHLSHLKFTIDFRLFKANGMNLDHRGEVELLRDDFTFEDNQQTFF
jgi:hypothetical protein